MWEAITRKFTKLHTKGPSTKLMRIVYAILNKIILWAFNSRSRGNDKFNRDFLSNRRSPEDHARKSWGNVTRCVMLLSNLLTDDTCKIINSTTRSGVRLVWAYVSENEFDLYFQAHLHREKCKEESYFTSLSCLILHDCISTQNPPTLWSLCFLLLIKMHFNCLAWQGDSAASHQLFYMRFAE